MSPPVERFVVFDCETTGLDPERDAILSIGAVAVCDGEILLDDAFESLVNDWRPTSAVLVHGITPREAASGLRQEEAVAAFLEYLGGSVLVGHHVGFDRAIVASAARRMGRAVANPALDTMRIALALQEQGAFAGAPIRSFELDALCERFGVAPHDRHTAAGDAFLTAQVFIRLERLARRSGLVLYGLLEPLP